MGGGGGCQQHQRHARLPRHLYVPHSCNQLGYPFATALKYKHMTACVVPFLLDPAAGLGRMSPWHMKSRCLDLVAAFLLGVSSAVRTRQAPTASVLARFRLPAWSSVHAWLLRWRLRTESDFAPECLPAPEPVWHVSSRVRRGAVADARLGLA